MLATVLPALLTIITVLQPTSRFLTTPNGIRIAFTENQYEVAFRWTTVLPQWDAVFLVRQTICNGVPDESEWEEIAPDWQWNFVWGSRTWEVVYSVLVTDIYPDCEYEYQIGAGIVWIHERSFSVRTPYDAQSPSQFDLAQPASLLIVGDLGMSPYGEQTRKSLQAFASTGRFVALLHLGDIAYDLDSVVAGISRAYFAEMEPIISKLPYMVMPGNHEDVYGFTKYMSDFRMPVNSANNGTNFFYSFNYGRCHFVAISTEHIYSYLSTEHLEWLRSDLLEANRNRENVPWVVVMGHRPLYCSQDFQKTQGWTSNYEINIDCGPRATILRGLMEDLFIDTSVDVVFQAHVHNYQRFTPIYHNQSLLASDEDLHVYNSPAAPVYILEGAGGNSEGNDPLTATPQSWVVVQSRKLGFGSLQIVNSTHLLWEHWDSFTQERIDYLWIVKSVDAHD